MALMYPNVNKVMASTPDSTLLLELRRLRAPRHEPSTTLQQHDDEDAEKDITAEAPLAVDFSSVFPMSFGCDDLLDEEQAETDPFGDNTPMQSHQHARDESSGAYYSHASASREASTSSVEPLMTSVDLPPPYSPPASAGLLNRAALPSMLQRNSQATRYLSLAGQDSSYSSQPSTVRVKGATRAEKGRSMSFSTTMAPAAANASTSASSVTTPPLVLELFMGHRLASKVARRRALKRTQQLNGVHAKWQALGVDTRAIVETATASGSTNGSKTQQQQPSHADEKVAAPAKLSGKARQAQSTAEIDEAALQQVKAAKHLLPPSFWQPPNYGPQEMDRQLRAMGL